jgi:hypothetical protein
MIQLDQARKLLKMAVDTQGRDFQYCSMGEGCYYFALDDNSRDSLGHKVYSATNDPRRKTACLIGVALDLAGETRHHNFDDRVNRLATKYPDMMSTRAARYFYVAQQHQDNGDTWGKSYDAAEEYLNKYLNNSE